MVVFVIHCHICTHCMHVLVHCGNELCTLYRYSLHGSVPIVITGSLICTHCMHVLMSMTNTVAVHATTSTVYSEYRCGNVVVSLSVDQHMAVLVHADDKHYHKLTTVHCHSGPAHAYSGPLWQ